MNIGRLSFSYFGVVKIALMCGASLHFVQPAMAGWNKTVLGLESIDLSNLKSQCVEGRAKARENKVKDKDNSAKWNAKYQKWNKRGEKIVALQRPAEVNLDEVKHALLDKKKYLGQFLSKFQAPGPIVTEKEVKEEDIQHFIKVLEESDVGEGEKKRELSVLKSQLQKIQKETPSKTTTMTSSNDSTIMKEIAEGKAKSFATKILKEAWSHCHNIETEIKDLETVLQDLTFVPGPKRPVEDSRVINQLNSKLMKLRNAKEAGLKFYTKEEELIPFLPPDSVKQEKLIEGSQVPLFNIVKEIGELETNLLPVLENFGGNEQQLKEVKTRLQRLKKAQSLGVTEYSTENELIDLTGIN